MLKSDGDAIWWMLRGKGGNSEEFAVQQLCDPYLSSEHFRGELLTVGRYTNPAPFTFNCCCDTGIGRQERSSEIPRQQLPEHDACQALHLHNADETWWWLEPDPVQSLGLHTAGVRHQLHRDATSPSLSFHFEFVAQRDVFMIRLGTCGIVILFRFGFWKKLGFGSEWVWFGFVWKKTRIRFGYCSCLLLM